MRRLTESVVRKRQAECSIQQPLTQHFRTLPNVLKSDTLNSVIEPLKTKSHSRRTISIIVRREWDFVLRKIDIVFRRRINGITMPLFLPPQSFCNKNQRHQKINLAHFLLIFWKQRRVNSSFRGQNLKKARHCAPIIYKKAVPLQNDASYTPTLHSTPDALHASRHKQSVKREG